MKLTKSWKSRTLVTLLAAAVLNGMGAVLVEAQQVPVGQVPNQAVNGVGNGNALQQMTGLELGYRFGYHPNWGVRPIEWFLNQGIPYYFYAPIRSVRMARGWPSGPSFGGSGFPKGPSYGGGAFPAGPSYGGGGANMGGARPMNSKAPGVTRKKR